MDKHALPAVERNLFLPALAGFFIAGIWLAPHVSEGLWPLWILPLAALTAVALRALRLPMRLICLPVALMLALLWTQFWLNPTMPAEGTYEAITATVYGDSKISASGNVTFTVTGVTLNGEEQPGRAYATIYQDSKDGSIRLTDGMRIRFTGKVYQPYPKGNEYDFDSRMWMLQNGLNFGITSVRDVEVLAQQAQWANYAQRIASACHEKLKAVMGEQADLAVATLLGQREELSEDDYEAFQRAGVAHIIAVSGLHVGILTMALIWLLERLRLRKVWQVPVVAVFLVFYCGVTGFAVSSLRAAVMVLLWVTARALGRRTNPVTVLSTAALIVLIINPLQLFSAGFILSFSAVAGIALLYPQILRGLNRAIPPVAWKNKRSVRYGFHRFFRWLKQAFAVTVSAQLGVTLPIAAYYHHFYPYSPLFNLPVVPMVGVLVPLYAVTTLILWIPWFGGWLGAALGAVAGLGSEAMLRLVRVSSELPLAEIRMAQPDAWVCVATFICAVTASHFVRASARKRLAAIAAVILIAVTGSVITAPPSLRYHQFSAGSADSALIIDGDTTIGIDTGSTGSEMINRLLAEGRDLDALILTHLHTDHAGGLEAILDEGIQIGRVYLPADYELHGYEPDILAVIQRLEDEGVPVTTLAAGDTLAFRETTIDVLWPQEGRTRAGVEPNDRSLVMLISLGGVRILHMADNGILYELYAAAPADILKVGHHGSVSTTGDAFLQAVNPSLAIVSERSDTLPAPALLERLDARGVRVLSTEDAGEITIVPVDGGYRAYRYLAEGSH